MRKTLIKIILGLALCIALPLNAGQLASTEEQGFELNLQNADIRALINMVSKYTGKNFVIHPSVRANNITVVTNKKMNKDELYDVFLSVLQIHGYAAVPTNDVIKIVLDNTARQQSVPIVAATGKANDQLITQVVPVDNVNAVQIIPMLRPLIPGTGHIGAYPGSNQVVITDRASNIKRIVRIIKRLDQAEDSEYTVVRLQHAAAKNTVQLVQAIQKKGQAAQYGAAQFVADERSNSILISGSSAERQRIAKLIKTMDVPLDQGGNTKVVYLQYAKAKTLADILKGVNEGQKKAQAAQQKQAPSSEKAVDIQADEETNALVITASPDDMRDIENVIEKLDIRRAQIHVEAIIAELTDDTAAEFGFSYIAGSEKVKSNQPLGVMGLGAGGAVIKEIVGVSQKKSVPNLISNGFTVAFGKQRDSGTIFAGIVRALAADGKNNILSTPSIVTIDNQEAEIIVGQNVPFITGTFTTSGSGSNNPFQTIERKDVGIKLKIKPQISKGNTIQMKIEQEVSDAFNDAATGQLITNKRNINTNVLIEDGQMLVLGGLIDDQEKKNIAKVPLLGDIPLLGRLFQYRTSGKKKRNLMVFIHPTIIKDRRLADIKTAEKYNFMRSKQEAASSSWFAKPDIILPRLELHFAPPIIEHINATAKDKPIETVQMKQLRELQENETTSHNY